MSFARKLLLALLSITGMAIAYDLIPIIIAEWQKPFWSYQSFQKQLKKAEAVEQQEIVKKALNQYHSALSWNNRNHLDVTEILQLYIKQYHLTNNHENLEQCEDLARRLTKTFPLWGPAYFFLAESLVVRGGDAQHEMLQASLYAPGRKDIVLKSTLFWLREQATPSPIIHKVLCSNLYHLNQGESFRHYGIWSLKAWEVISDGTPAWGKIIPETSYNAKYIVQHFLKNKQPLQAQWYLSKIEEPYLAERYFLEGQLHLQQQNWGNAVHAYREAILKSSEGKARERCILSASQDCLLQGVPPHQALTLTKFFTTNRLENITKVAWIAFRKNYFDEVFELLKKENLENYPKTNQAQAYLLLSLCTRKNKDLKSTLHWARKAAKADSSRKQYIQNFYAILIELGLDYQIEFHLKQMHAEYSKPIEIYLWLTKSYQKLRNNKLAKKYIQKAFEMEPTNQEVFLLWQKFQK